MKLERSDTVPIKQDEEGNNGGEFSNMLLGEGPNLSLSRIDTAALNSLVDGIDNGNRNEVPLNLDAQSLDLLGQSNIDHTFLMPMNPTTNIENELVHFMETNNFEIPFNHLPITEENLEQVEEIARKVSLPPSTSSTTHTVDSYGNEVTSTICSIIPTLLPWPGNFNFCLSIFADEKDRNKVSVSEKFNKLYICPNYVVPVTFSLSNWDNISLSVMPVYKSKVHQKEVVKRCHNCKTSLKFESTKHEHILHIEDDNALYENIQGHHVVSVPLTPPRPGENSATILLKTTCLTSCVGGPNRRPFYAVFTVKSNGVEIGRRIIEIRCCRCPGRDKDNEESLSKKTKMIKKIKISDACDTKPNKRKKTENSNDKMATIEIPVEFVPDVKRYVNQLYAEKYVKEVNPRILPFPDSD